MKYCSFAWHLRKVVATLCQWQRNILDYVKLPVNLLCISN